MGGWRKERLLTIVGIAWLLLMLLLLHLLRLLLLLVVLRGGGVIRLTSGLSGTAVGGSSVTTATASSIKSLLESVVNMITNNLDLYQ